MTREETIEILMMVQAAYPNFSVPDKKVTVNTWFLFFENYPVDVIKGALMAYITSDKNGFAPAIGQIIEIAESMTNEQEIDSMAAWSLVSKALRNGYYHAREEFEKLPKLVQQAVGSPDNLRNWSTSDYSAIETVIQSNFLRSYRICVERDKKMRCMPKQIRNRIESNIPVLHLPESEPKPMIEEQKIDGISEKTEKLLEEFKRKEKMQ